MMPVDVVSASSNATVFCIAVLECRLSLVFSNFYKLVLIFKLSGMIAVENDYDRGESIVSCGFPGDSWAALLNTHFAYQPPARDPLCLPPRETRCLGEMFMWSQSGSQRRCTQYLQGAREE